MTLGWLWPPAAALSFAAGFALQRGGICSVRAVRDAVERGRWTLFSSLIECALWSFALIALAHSAGVNARVVWPEHQLLLMAFAGGSVFGLGALINGACAFGSVGRIASGDISYLSLLPGFALGAIAALRLGLSASLSILKAHPSATVFGVGAIAIVVFAVARLALAWRMRAMDAPAHGLRVRRWPAPLAMAVIAIANVGLMLMVNSWPYTTFMIDVLTGRAGDAGVRALVVTIFFAGALAGAVSAGRFAWRRLVWKQLAAHFTGGALMGFGSALIPGGNDALILMGLPLLQPAAIVAHAGMLAAIAGGVLSARRLKLADVRTDG